MMSMMDLLDELQTKVTDIAFAAWAWDMPPLTEAWATVSADGGRQDRANGIQDDAAITGTVDLYARTRIADRIEAVEAILNESGMPWALGDILYDRDARAVHIVWDWETVEGIGS